MQTKPTHKNQSPRLYIVLDNIRSAFNVGSIFRTADAVGGCEILLCGITSKVDNPKLYKTALGAIDSVPSKYFADPMEAITYLESQSIPIYAVELTEQAEHFQKAKYPSPVAIVLGHELVGVSQPILDRCEKVVYIPMAGIKESLNVANAAGIVLYEAVREV